MARNPLPPPDVEIIEVDANSDDPAFLIPSTATSSSPINSPKKLRRAMREERALELRVRASLSHTQIAEVLKSEGLADANYGEVLVRGDIERGIEKRRQQGNEDVEAVIMIELDRLDALQAAWFGRAIGEIAPEVQAEIGAGVEVLREAMAEARERLLDGRAETARDLRALIDAIRESIKSLMELHEKYGPDARAAKVVLSVMERRARLLGLDTVVTHAMTADTQTLHIATQVATLTKVELRQVMQNLALADGRENEVIIEHPRIIEQDEEE